MTEPATANRHRREAFERYVQPEVPAVWRVALALTRQPADAEDLVQDVLVRAFEAIDRFDGQYPRAWLLTILRNTHRKRGGRAQSQLVYEPNLVLERLTVVSLPGHQSPERVVVGSEFHAVAANAFGALPASHRAVIQLVDVEGLTYEEAARALHVAKGTVTSRLHRARARVRTELAAAGLTPRRGRR